MFCKLSIGKNLSHIQKKLCWFFFLSYLSVLKKKWLFKHYFNSTSKLQNLFKISLYGFQLSFIDVVAVSCWENTLLKACPLCVFCYTFPSCTCTTIVFLSNTIPPNGRYCIISLDSLQCAVKQTYGMNLDTEHEGSLVCITSWSVYWLEIKISVLFHSYTLS